MKKATKTTKSKKPAPAKKAVKAATKAVKKAVTEVKKAAVKEAAVKKTSTKKTIQKVTASISKQTPVSAKKTVTSRATKITITAKVDIGYGNTLFLRGEGKGLSWDQGVSMTCVADDEWSVTVSKSAQPRVFKFLINDQVWCTGEDYSLRSNQSGTFAPSF